MCTVACFSLWLSFLFVWAAPFSLIILGSRRRAGLGARMSYAGLILLAPLVTPYMVRALFVFRRPVHA